MLITFAHSFTILYMYKSIIRDVRTSLKRMEHVIFSQIAHAKQSLVSHTFNVTHKNIERYQMLLLFG